MNRWLLMTNLGILIRKHQITKFNKVKQTYQAVDHLIKNCSKAPPVHCPVIRFFTKNFWCQILQTEKKYTHKQNKNKYLNNVNLLKNDISLSGWLHFFHSAYLDFIFSLTSGVPQKVEVVPSGSTPSLHSPKSVSTTWPCAHKTQVILNCTKHKGFRRSHRLTCESRRIFSGFRSLLWTRINHAVMTWTRLSELTILQLV